jgi:uncharacterized protein YbjT (DUF2867 family)
MLCVKRDALRQEHQATVQSLRKSIHDVVVLVDNSGADPDLNLAHIRIRSARGVCDAARANLEYHQGEHEC